MRKILIILLIAVSRSVSAQWAASDALTAGEPGVIVPYNLSEAGVSQPVRWGIDTAWLWSWWPLRATNHMQECVSLGRVTINPRVSGSYTELSQEQKDNFDLQLSWLEKSGVKTLYLLAGNTSETKWQSSYSTAFVQDIALGVTYLQAKGYTVTAISPFNEPDYSPNNAPTVSGMVSVAQLIRANDVTKDIDLTGPNTLNCDYGKSWWNTMKNAVQIGNTHQLAGTFDNFAGFYGAVRTAGKKSAGDEMHNINDALIGMNYGMSDGIWWSDFGSYTRAELGRASNDGMRIGYAENRLAWTSAAVFRRNSEQLAEAFLGTSERQATESAYTFVSQDRLAYYDGYGPYYDYTKATPGGTGYQTGQTNSEYVIEITYGEEVPVGPINGDFKIVNKATGRLLTVSSASGGNISQARESATALQTWTVKPLGMRDAADFAHVTIACSANPSYYLDALKYAGDNGAKVQSYPGSGNECERWHLRYKGDGWYVITNYDSGLSLEGSSNNTDATPSAVCQWARTGSDRQLWRFVPANATVETTAPAAPLNLKARGRSGSIELMWMPNSESDLLGYMVYRCDETTGLWETVGRQVGGASFIDNYCIKGHNYRYRIRAVDAAWNLSEPSGEVTAATTDASGLVGSWPMGENLNDAGENRLNASGNGITHNAGETHPCAVFDGNGSISLPYNVANMHEMTFSAWVKPASTTAWQRIFDFGRDTENYVMLTTSNGSVMRFEICKDGVKQGVNASRRLTSGQWSHVAVTLGEGGARIYINGSLNASSSSVTLRPDDVPATLAYLGRSMFSTDALLKGSMSDVRLYNKVLDAADIRGLGYAGFTEAMDLLMQPMNKEVRASLQHSMDETRAVMVSGSAADIDAALSALASACDAARPSVEAYKQLGEALERSQRLATDHPQADTEAEAAYNKAFEKATADWLDGEHTDEQIPAAITDVRAFTNGYLTADARQLRTEFADITHLLINADFSDDIANWTLVTGKAGYSGSVGYDCLELRDCTFLLQQTLPGMPSGCYRLETQAFYRNGPKENSDVTEVNAQLFINEKMQPIAPVSLGANRASSAGEWYAYVKGKFVPVDHEAAGAAFTVRNRYLPSETVNRLTVDNWKSTDGVLNIGLCKEVGVSDDWTAVHHFRLFYHGSDNPEGIETVNGSGITVNGSTDDDAWYDLSGRRYNRKPVRKGIYIHNRERELIQ